MIHTDETIEHIVPRSLGNLHYILPRGLVCAKCNHNFGRIENRVLSSHRFLEERRRLRLLRPRNDVVPGVLDEMDLARFLLKMAYESLYKSRMDLWRSTNFTPLLGLLLDGLSDPVFNQRDETDALNWSSIPRWIQRFRLQNNHLRLEYALNEDRLYFRFQFGKIRSNMRVA